MSWSRNRRFPAPPDFEAAIAVRDRVKRVVIVGENDHYKPQAVKLRRLLADDVIGDVVFGYFTSIAKRLKTADDWRNDETMAGGDAFFEEGIHWLHLAGSLGPRITTIEGVSPRRLARGDRTVAPRSMLVSFRYDNGGVGSLYYSREIPSLLKGMRLSAIYGREESSPSNRTVCSFWEREGTAAFHPAGFYDFRGYRAMYRDFLRAIREGSAPEMSLERAMDDQRLMDQIYASLRS
jgi:predicted dehydrogenase